MLPHAWIQICIVDNHFAAIGGLDTSFGRWDTQSHPVADAHPTVSIGPSISSVVR